MRVIVAFRADTAIINSQFFKIKCVTYFEALRPTITSYLIRYARIVFYIGIEFFYINIKESLIV